MQITRLARGITTGSVLEFANKEILADAMTRPADVLRAVDSASAAVDQCR